MHKPRRKLEYEDLEEIVVSKHDLPLADVKKQTKTSLAMSLCDIIQAAGRPAFATTALQLSFADKYLLKGFSGCRNRLTDFAKLWGLFHAPFESGPGI